MFFLKKIVLYLEKAQYYICKPSIIFARKLLLSQRQYYICKVSIIYFFSRATELQNIDWVCRKNISMRIPSAISLWSGDIVIVTFLESLFCCFNFERAYVLKSNDQMFVKFLQNLEKIMQEFMQNFFKKTVRKN